MHVPIHSRSRSRTLSRALGTGRALFLAVLVVGDGVADAQDADASLPSRCYPVPTAPCLHGNAHDGVPSAASGKAAPAPCRPIRPPSGWFSGNTHSHIQGCFGTLLDKEGLLQRMDDEGLDVSSVLIWQPILQGGFVLHPFTQFACLVSGLPEPGTGEKAVQFGVETSGLECSDWGHLIGQEIGPIGARIAVSGSDPADCYTSATGLGLGCPGGDGTGVLPGPVAEHFALSPHAVRGMAHQAWPADLYSPLGFDWFTELVQSGFTVDAVCLDTARLLAFPKVFGVSKQLRRLYPSFGAVDYALGRLEFFETFDMNFDFDLASTVDPRTEWYGLYYRLLNAGFRPSPAAGQDTLCQTTFFQRLGLPYTWAKLDGPLSYRDWNEALRAGRVTLSTGNDRFLDFTVDGQEIGSTLAISSELGSVRVEAVLLATCSTRDWIEVVRNGEVVAAASVDLSAFDGEARVVLDVPMPESGWLVARLRSKRAHTAATYVIVDDEPIGDCLDAEYWMMWIDRLRKQAIDEPGVHYGCQDAAVLADTQLARSLFRSARDYDFYPDGLDPAWNLRRRGTWTAACRGPMPIGIDGPVFSGEEFRLNCRNAPPRTTGLLYLSRRAAPGTVQGNVALFVDLGALLVPPIPVISRSNGCAQTLVDDPAILALPAGGVLHAQYVWTNPADCPGAGVSGTGSSQSASDALRIVLQQPRGGVEGTLPLRGSDTASLRPTSGSPLLWAPTTPARAAGG